MNLDPNADESRSASYGSPPDLLALKVSLLLYALKFEDDMKPALCCKLWMEFGFLWNFKMVMSGFPLMLWCWFLAVLSFTFSAISGITKRITWNLLFISL
ncbi:hypothetical protein L2E82_40192 [Cichorium intybus]|uniref:Uncharacterized protein n=1 Tax=Cichorium intybus TaxID=13427 RepID=A0ACB9AKM4_CICIN|nr:hypothetical protein L2E82_40192 [Cichorium intybus]